MRAAIQDLAELAAISLFLASLFVWLAILATV